MDPAAIGWREALLAAVVIVALWLGLTLFRLAQLGATRRASASAAGVAAPPLASDALWKAEMEDELRRLSTELAAMREELTQLRAMKSVAPQYGDAVGLAQRGMDAEAIAGRCGISVAEAELIRALARQPGE